MVKKRERKRERGRERAVKKTKWEIKKKEIG
jgi:hypothetical protein